MIADVLRALLGEDAALPPHQRSAILDAAAAIGREHRFFHWELEFPEVFFDAAGRRDPAGGFDAVIGNPPWDALRADTGDEASRDRARPARATRLRFFRTSGLYRHQGGGHANRYRLFVERALHLARPGGRLALVVPSGLANDHGSGPLRRALLDGVQIDRLIGFDNRRGIFPIHRDVKFLLLTGTVGRRTERLTGAFGQTEPAWLDTLPDACGDDPPAARPIVMGRALLDMWDPEHLAFPMLTSADDLAILAHVSTSVPRLGDPAGWGATFGRELNATEDARHFVAVPGGGDRRTSADLLPIVEGKHLDSFRQSARRPGMAIPRAAAAMLLDAAKTFDRTRLAYRDVASATNRLTLIAVAPSPRSGVDAHRVLSEDGSRGSGPVLSPRAPQQSRRQLSGAAAGHHARHHIPDDPPARPPPRPRLARVP